MTDTATLNHEFNSRCLTRCHEINYTQFQATISWVTYDFLDVLRKENTDCTDLRLLQQQLCDGALIDSAFTQRDDILYHKNRFYLSRESRLKNMVLHESPKGGHARVERKYICLGANFFWDRMRSKSKILWIDV